MDVVWGLVGKSWTSGNEILAKDAVTLYSLACDFPYHPLLVFFVHHPQTKIGPLTAQADLKLNLSVLRMTLSFSSSWDYRNTFPCQIYTVLGIKQYAESEELWDTPS